MNPALISALVAAALSFGGAWTIQDWRYGAKEAKRVTQQISLEREVRVMDSKRTAGLAAAQNNAVTRSVALRAAASASRTERDGLRDQTDAALLGASASHAACLERATTASAVLNQCAAAYQDLGERADRHVSDLQTLTEAWPKE